MNAYFNLFILIVTYILAEIAKKIMVKIKAEGYRDLIPHICLLIGGLLAILLFYVYPAGLSETITDPLQAFICGALSGAAATGSNQLFARTIKFKNTVTGGFQYGDYSDSENEWF